MAKRTNNTTITDFLDYYFKGPKKEYSKNEIPQHKTLIKSGVLYENNLDKDILVINNLSKDLLNAVLTIAEIKTNKKLPIDLSKAFAFIQEFENILREEYKPPFHNSYDLITKKFRPYVISVLYQQGVSVKDFLLSLNNEERENHLFTFERSFFDFLPTSNYSEKEIFEICNQINTKFAEHDVILFLRNSFAQGTKFGNKLLKYALKNNIKMRFISDLLIGAYNSRNLSNIDEIIDLKEKNLIECLFVLGRLDFNNELDVEKAFALIENVELENVEIARNQSYLFRNIVENEFTTDVIRQKSFKLYVNFIENGTDNIRECVFQDIHFIENHEDEKYKLLHHYLSKGGNFGVIKNFFYNINNPRYVFDLMMRLFNTNPNFRFSIDLFEDGIIHAWNTNTLQTEEQILNLFKQHPAFGILALKVILCSHFNILFVDLSKLEKSDYQINAINNVCKYPHSFDSILPLILPLRNSKFKEVREHLQNLLAEKVFLSYHDIIHNQIKDAVGTSKKDKEFLLPITKALNDYHTLKKLKESINDLNPYENERNLMDLYYRLEHEEQAKAMKRVDKGKGTFLESIKSNIIVRGNSFRFDEGEPTPLAKIESIMLIDGISYLNPDLYENNLNITG